jgi:hypothetical protein
MEDNFALRYVFTYPGIISRAELVPSVPPARGLFPILIAESGIFFDSHVSVTIITEGLLTETIPDSSSILLLIWQTFERRRLGKQKMDLLGTQLF